MTSLLDNAYGEKLQVLKSSLGINIKRHVLIFDAFDSVLQNADTN